MPPQARISNVKFSPDGSKLAFLQTKDAAIELWVADGTTGTAKAVVTGADRINATTGDPCDWVRDNVTMVCKLVPASRGPAPAEPAVPAGPNVHENYGKAAPAPTYEDLLEDRARRCAVHVLLHEPAGGDQHRDRREDADRPSGDLRAASRRRRTGSSCSSRGSRSRISHTVPMNGFPQDVEVWTRTGEVAKKLADLPSREGTSLTGVEPGPRGFQWRADQPATIVWIEALDGGDLKNKVPFRDKVMSRYGAVRRRSRPRSRRRSGDTAASRSRTQASRC